MHTHTLFLRWALVGFFAALVLGVALWIGGHFFWGDPIAGRRALAAGTVTLLLVPFARTSIANMVEYPPRTTTFLWGVQALGGGFGALAALITLLGAPMGELSLAQTWLGPTVSMVVVSFLVDTTLLLLVAVIAGAHWCFTDGVRILLKWADAPLGKNGTP